MTNYHIMVPECLITHHKGFCMPYFKQKFMKDFNEFVLLDDNEIGQIYFASRYDTKFPMLFVVKNKRVQRINQYAAYILVQLYKEKGAFDKYPGLYSAIQCLNKGIEK